MHRIVTVIESGLVARSVHGIVGTMDDGSGSSGGWVRAVDGLNGCYGFGRPGGCYDLGRTVGLESAAPLDEFV